MSVETLIEEVHPSTPPQSLVHKRGPFPRSERIRTQAFERFLNGEPLLAISKDLDCSHQYLYKLARKEDWAGRKVQIQRTALLDGGEAVEQDSVLR